MALLFDIGLIIIIATLLAYVARMLKQPMILAYIVTGILLGPSVFNLITSFDDTYLFAELGVAFLLFLVGLNLNFNVLKEVGRVSVITGVGQVLFTSAIGFLISMALGIPPIESLYISIALTFSSTIIIVKLLSDKKDTDSLYGKISIGFLIVQDIIAIIILVLLSSFGTTNIQTFVVENIVKLAVLFGIVFFFTKFIIPSMLDRVAKNTELLFLTGVSWLLVMTMLTSYLGFSIEIGALLAGISMAALPYQYEIGSRLKPLRDFFLIFFFIILGAQMEFAFVSNLMLPVIVFSLFVLIGNPLIVMVLMGSMGYRKRTSLFAGMTVAQISEFSLVLVALGFSLGHIGAGAVSLVTLVGIITITLSTYMILYNNRIYNRLGDYLRIFERKKLKEKIQNSGQGSYDIILLGYHRMGYNMMKNIRNNSTLIVDFNPSIIREASSKKLNALYGDVTDGEIIDKLISYNPKLVVSTVPDFEDNLFVIEKFKSYNRNTLIFTTTDSVGRALELYKRGADYVIVPHILGGEKAQTLIREFLKKDVKDIQKEKNAHLSELREYAKLGQLHL